MNKTKAFAWICTPNFLLMLLAVDGYNVDITYVQSAVAKGAVCLDGSPPAYHFSPGFGSGVNNWLLMIEGGAWCDNATTCLARSNTPLGSSKQMAKTLYFSGILSNEQQLSPDFYNWNKVKVRYCDGSSFTGDVEGVDPETNLHYRGGRVWLAVIEDLLAKGMSKAQNVLLSGCSAGGLAVILHCDRFSSLLPSSTRVKCLSDAGFFINEKDLTGTERIKAFYNDVVTTHGSAKNLLSSCTSKMSPGMCFFPQYVAQETSTPLFLLNAAYDSWQIPNILAPEEADPDGTWHDCKFDITKCSSAQLQTIQGYRSEFLSALAGLGTSSTRGTFINSCYTHCQAEMQEIWLSSESPLLRNTTIAKAVGDWYFDRQNIQLMDDCPYPCDKTCHNSMFLETIEKSRISFFTNTNHSHHFIFCEKSEENKISSNKEKQRGNNHY